MNIMMKTMMMVFFFVLSLRGEDEDGIVIDPTEPDATKRGVHDCGWPKVNGDPCANKIGDGVLACHHHVKFIEDSVLLHEEEEALDGLSLRKVRSIQEMITTLKGEEMSTGPTIRYMIVSIDEETDRPLVWRHIITNMVHKPSMLYLEDGQHLVPIDVGEHYHMAFMEELLPEDEPWVIEVVPVGALPRVEDRSECALAWADDTSATFVYLPNHPYWGALQKVLGIGITPHSKLSKRLKEVTRDSRFFHVFEPGELSIHVFDPEDAVEYYDGQTIVKPWVVLKTARTTADRRYLAENAKRWIFRATTEDGVIKGDGIMAYSDDAFEADIVTSADNLKKEFKLLQDGRILVTVSLHHDHHEAYTDIQTLSWLGETLFPIEGLRNTLNDVCNDVINDIRKGIFPKYMDHDTSDFGLYGVGDTGTVKFLREMYNRWQDKGMKLNQSARFIHSIGGGLLNHMRSGMKFPISHAAYVHVTTHEMLYEAGYPIEGFEDVVFYHDATGSLSLPGELFTKLFKNHGGWDLDDSVRILVREFADGIKGVLLRSPNAFGEYSIVEIDLDSLLPILYNTKRAIPCTTLTTSEFEAKVPNIHSVDKVVTYKGMPTGTGTDAERYTQAEAQATINAMSKSPGMGRWANVQMVYYASTGTYRTSQLAHIEDIVDCLTQSADPEGFDAIAADIKQTWVDLAEFGSVERYFVTMDPRISRDGREILPANEKGYIKTHDGYMTKLCIQHRLIMNAFEDLIIEESNWARAPIPELLELEVSPAAKEWAQKEVVKFKTNCGKVPHGKEFKFLPRGDVFTDASQMVLSMQATKYYRDLNSEVVKALVEADNGPELLIAIYQWTEYKRQHKDVDGIDRILFSMNHPGEPSVMDLLLKVIKRRTD